MSSVGGPIRECSINKRIFQCTSDAGATLKPGVYSNEVKVSGGGKPYMLKKVEPSELSGLVVLIDNDRDDMKFLNDLAASNDFFPMTVTLADGRTWQGSEVQMEKPEYNTAEGTAAIKLMGGPLELQ
jgi:hypothetical protein